MVARSFTRLFSQRPARIDGCCPPSLPRDYAGLFAVERDRLTELLDGLQAADWERPSPCPGWTVLGLCCHLVGDDLGLLARNRDGYHGTPAPAGYLAVSGNDAITAILLRTRAIIGAPIWA